MNQVDRGDFHIYGTGTVEGYKTVCCSETLAPLLCREIDRHCMRFGGNRRIEVELESQPLTLTFLSNRQVLISLWRPSSVPDSRNRPNPMEAASVVLNFDYLQQRGFPLNEIRNLLGRVNRQEFPRTLNLKADDPNSPGGAHLIGAYRFCQNGQYSSKAGFTSGSARWMSLLPPRYRFLNAIVSHDNFEATRAEGFASTPLPENFCAILGDYKAFGLQIKFANDWDDFYPNWVKRERHKKMMRVINFALQAVLFIALVAGASVGGIYLYKHLKNQKNSENTTMPSATVNPTPVPTDTVQPKEKQQQPPAPPPPK